MKIKYHKAPHKYKRGDKIILVDVKKYQNDTWKNIFSVGMTGTIRFRNHYNDYVKPLLPNYQPSYSVDWDNGLKDWWINESMIKKVNE